MKNLSILAVLPMLIACSAAENKVLAEKEKTYTLRVESKEYSSVHRYDDKVMRYEIKAKSDSEAYEKGMTSFIKWQNTYDTGKTVSMWKSESFTVQDDDNNNILEKLDASLIHSIQKKFQPLHQPESNKTNRHLAFKDWKFGSAIENTSNKDARLQTFGKNMYYYRTLSDDSLGLYRVILESPETNAKSYESKVKKSYDNLYKEFSGKFGSGMKINSFPSMKELSRGYIRWVHEWNEGNKNIKIGIGSLLNGVEYFSACWITDKDLMAAYNTRMRNKVLK